MKAFIQQTFTDSRGKISMRRTILCLFSTVYVAAFIVNLVNNKNVLNPLYEGHLYNLVWVLVGSVVAERAMNKLGGKEPIEVTKAAQ
jgi:hypothetical protein